MIATYFTILGLLFVSYSDPFFVEVKKFVVLFSESTIVKPDESINGLILEMLERGEKEAMTHQCVVTARLEGRKIIPKPKIRYIEKAGFLQIQLLANPEECKGA